MISSLVLVTLITIVTSENLDKRAHVVSHVDTEVTFRMALLDGSYLRLFLGGDAMKTSFCARIKAIASQFPSTEEQPFGLEDCRIDIDVGDKVDGFDKGDIKVVVMFLGKYNYQGLEHVINSMQNPVAALSGGRYLYRFSSLDFTELEVKSINVYVNTHEVKQRSDADKRQISALERQIAKLLFDGNNSMDEDTENNSRELLSKISVSGINKSIQRRNDIFSELQNEEENKLTL